MPAKKRELITWPPAPAASAPPVMWERLNDYSVRVYLKVALTPPFEGAGVERWGPLSEEGFVDMVGGNGKLVVGGQEIHLHRFKDQLGGGCMAGPEIRRQAPGLVGPHPNIMDAVAANDHIFPDSWKRLLDGKAWRLHLFNVAYIDQQGRRRVRAIHWDGDVHCGRCVKTTAPIEQKFGYGDPILVFGPNTPPVKF